MTPASGDPAQYRMVESDGRYSDRKVTYFRVFVPVLAAQASLDVRAFNDLDQHQNLIVRSGHVERDGTVILTRPVVVRAAAGPSRTQADRALHLDDAHIVRGETGVRRGPDCLMLAPEHCRDGCAASTPGKRRRGRDRRILRGRRLGAGAAVLLD